jgi:thiol-disulfide isomerase/thioredoxin
MNVFKIIAITSIVFFYNYSESIKAQGNNLPNAYTLLNNTIAALQKIQTVQFTYTRNLNYVSEAYYNTNSGSVFLDYTTYDSLIGFTFQCQGNKQSEIYNGAELLLLNHDDKTMTINYTPILEDLDSYYFCYNSISSLRTGLVKIAADSTIPKLATDTLINNKPYYVLKFILKNKYINNLGGFEAVTQNINYNYSIVIDTETYMPQMVVQRNNLTPNDYVLSTFTNLQINNAKVDAQSWYNGYYKNYTANNEAKIVALPLNAKAPVFNLPIFNTTKKLNSKQIKTRYTLLEFWFKNCSNCIAAVPFINSLNSNYKKQLTVIGINSVDTQKDINFFYSKYTPNYNTVLDNTGSLIQQYGIDGYPHTVIIDNTTGKIAYTGAIDEASILKLLKKQ